MQSENGVAAAEEKLGLHGTITTSWTGNGGLISNSSTSADSCFDALSLSLLLSQSLSVEKHTKCIPQVNVSDLVT